MRSRLARVGQPPGKIGQKGSKIGIFDNFLSGGFFRSDFVENGRGCGLSDLSVKTNGGIKIGAACTCVAVRSVSRNVDFLPEYG